MEKKIREDESAWWSINEMDYVEGVTTSLETLLKEEGLRWEDIIDGETPSAEEIAIRREAVAKVREIIRTKLTPRQAAAVEAYLGGMRYRDIGERMKTTRQAAQFLVHRGIAKIGYWAQLRLRRRKPRNFTFRGVDIRPYS